MRICIQMLYTSSWLDIAKITVPNIVNYCRKHGYIWNIQTLPEPYDAFEKIRKIQNIFKANEADVVMSMDCDALITNYLKKVEDLVDSQHDFYISKDYNGLNAGVFLIKQSNWANMFLGRTFKYKSRPNIHCEQDAFEKYIAIEGYKNIKTLPQNQINSYNYLLYKEIPPQNHDEGNWEVGDFIIHFPGVSMEQRLKLIQNTPVIL